jgi:hypothetical protein
MAGLEKQIPLRGMTARKAKTTTGRTAGTATRTAKTTTEINEGEAERS